ncbi:MAG: oligopeptide transporter, OPT family [Acidobacteriota bacterium]
MKAFEPYIHHSRSLPDLTLRAALAGVVMGAVFGSANAYLGLKVGLTISTSIPLAVISVALFKVVGRVLRPTNILECNVSQTGGSAASSIASGLIFTIPALFMWGLSPSLLQVGTLAVLGGVLGILFMIPLRPYLIVKEHETLPYPEGTAAAQVLIAADSGGSRARNVFLGMGVGALYKTVLEFGQFWSSEIHLKIPLLKKGEVGLEPMPALLGVGYILGYRIGAIMVAGGLLSSLALIPIIAHFGEALGSPLFPETSRLVSEMTPGQIWSRYIRYVGAGAVAFAGITTVIRSLPTMYRSLVDGLKGLTREGRLISAATLRTQRDLPMSVVLVGALVVLLVAALGPFVLGLGAPAPLRVFGSVTILAFAFMFVTVSSRIVGLVGVTSNPTSGMAIVTLLGTSLIFFLLGWTDDVGKATVLTIGTVVCVAASIAGDISQDLKCGYIIGATPSRQQTVELIGAVTAAFAVAASIFLLGKSLSFGSIDLPAPQATLMKTVIEGVLQANLPWGLVLVGAALSLVASLLGVPALPFAVGIYLPVSSMMPVFLGGCLRSVTDWMARRRNEDPADQTERGVLVGSGLIAGEGLMGVAVAAYAAIMGARPSGYRPAWLEGWDQVLAAVVFALVALFLVRMIRRKTGSEAG